MKKRSQWAAPLYQAAKAYLRRNNLSMHVPLHGRGRGAPHLLRSGFGPIVRWDLTEVGNLDDLHLPAGVLRQAQLLAARLFGASETFFLVNGVTGGLLALLSSVTRPGDKVLLSRLSHKAVLHGLMLCGALPVYLPVQREPGSGFPLNVTATAVKRALRQHPDARLVVLTSPSYWGVTAELKAIAGLCHRHGVLFAVDEAHGAHLPFDRDLPHSGAAEVDFWLHSGHKALGALTPGAYLHLKNTRYREQLRFWLQALQTSSPSYPVMISLDLARRQAALQGKKLFGRTREWAGVLRDSLAALDLQFLAADAVKKAGFALDPCRVTLLPAGGGNRLASRLARQSGLQVEMSGEHYLLAVCSPALLHLTPQRLALSFSKAARKQKSDLTANSNLLPPFCFASADGENRYMEPFPMSPAAALTAPTVLLPLEMCAERVCGEMIISAPPGIPLIAPGERISAEMVATLLQMRELQYSFQGAADPALQTIKVVTAG